MKPTADLCDELSTEVAVIAPGLRDFGGLPAFHGPVTTLRLFEDNALVRAVLETSGDGRVLVIDGGGSVACALVGGNLGKLAAANGWAGIVVWGAVRDVAELREARVGIRALASNPRKSAKEGTGDRDVPITIGGVMVTPGQWLAADDDGVVVTGRRI